MTSFQRWYRRMKRTHHCVNCGAMPAVRQRLRCAACLEKRCQAASTRRHALKACGLCTQCRQPMTMDKTAYCAACQERQRQERQQRHANGQCILCRQPRWDHYVCCKKHHQDRKKATTAQRRRQEWQRKKLLLWFVMVCIYFHSPLTSENTP